MNWNDYEKLILNQIVEAKAIQDHTEKEYKQAKAKVVALEMQYNSFKSALMKLLGD